jgi:hypothetical protein
MRGTHFLETVEEGTFQDTVHRKKASSKGHSQTGEVRGRD